MSKELPEIWINGKGVNYGDDEYVDSTELVHHKEDNLEPFHIGINSAVARMIQCKICGGVEFNVADSPFFYTAIRCVKCKWEICFHEG